MVDGACKISSINQSINHCFFHGRHCGVAADGLGVILLENCDDFRSEFAMAFPSQSYLGLRLKHKLLSPEITAHGGLGL